VLCAYGASSLFDYVQGVQAHGCAALTVMLDAGGGALVHPTPTSKPLFPLHDLLARTGIPPRGVWLDVQRLSERNAPALLANLSALTPTPMRGRVLVETSDAGLARSPVARAFGDSGFVLSYRLPTELGCVCSRAGDAACAGETERLVRMLDGGAFRGVSFDARGRALARAIRDRISPRPVLNARTPMDRCANGDRAAPLDRPALDTLWREVQKYLAP
jgi:hypothetical protein